MILSYILHGHIPTYDTSSPHPDHILHEKLLRSHGDLLTVDIDALTDHFTASRFSYSTQALPVNVLLDTLVRPLGETEDAQKKTCLKWNLDPLRAVPHAVFGNTNCAGGQWVDNPVHASWEIGTLSYAGMISLPGYGFDEHYQRRNGRLMPTYLRPSRRAVADYLAAYPGQVGIADAIHNGQQISQVSRHKDGFYIASHKIFCKNLVLASGIFDILIPPPPLLSSLVRLEESTGTSADPILVVGSGFSAADVIISSPATQKIIHTYKWAPSTSPSPLRACHQQAYPEYAGVYRRMKVAGLSTSQATGKRPKARSRPSDFDLSRDWKSTYEGLPNAEITQVELTHDGAAIVTFRMGKEPVFQRRVGSLAYVVGRRGSLDYLSRDLLNEVLPSDYKHPNGTVSGQSLREKANEDLQVAPRVFVIGSLTGDSLIRFAYGGCAYAAGKIMPNQRKQERQRQRQTETETEVEKEKGREREKPTNGVPLNLRDLGNCRCQTPSPRIPAMNGLDGHEASPISLAERGVPLDRRKD